MQAAALHDWSNYNTGTRTPLSSLSSAASSHSAVRTALRDLDAQGGKMLSAADVNTEAARTANTRNGNGAVLKGVRCIRSDRLSNYKKK
jgi:hypothetical protein